MNSLNNAAPETPSGKVNKMDVARYADFYRDKLLNDVLPFWVRHSPDRQCGGYFTCLNRKGDVYDTDKFMWLQGRQVWVLSKMYRHFRQDESWLDLARLGAEFIRDHGFDENGRIYFALERDGKAYAKPRIFSDFFLRDGSGRVFRRSRVRSRLGARPGDENLSRHSSMARYQRRAAQRIHSRRQTDRINGLRHD
ncbi:MAG: AGE family epimerase/isomerase [Planctomycetota bacterium]|nr:AGE family epimerase/isomerase [Planctomycetota bacterium]